MVMRQTIQLNNRKRREIAFTYDKVGAKLTEAVENGPSIIGSLLYAEHLR
jgi:hypothetical protein